MNFTNSISMFALYRKELRTAISDFFTSPKTDKSREIVDPFYPHLTREQLATLRAYPGAWVSSKATPLGLVHMYRLRHNRVIRESMTTHGYIIESAEFPATEADYERDQTERARVADIHRVSQDETMVDLERALHIDFEK
jgi:hypothetical protein